MATTKKKAPAPVKAAAAPAKDTAPAPMSASAECLAFIASWESFSPIPYRCAAGVWTIGYGHAMHAGIERTLISKPAALELLKGDIKRFEDGVNALLRVKVSQTQFDALVSLAFNIGLGVKDGVKGDFADSTLLAHVNAGAADKAALEFEKWVYAAGKVVSGLRRRRSAERRMFEHGVYSHA